MSTEIDSKPVAVSGVTYQRAEEGYFEKRKLKRSAGVWGLWGMGVAAVISGGNVDRALFAEVLREPDGRPTV